MASPIIIPIVIVAIVGLTGYLVYRYVIYDFLCKISLDKTLKKYEIKKTPSQIIIEYHNINGKKISDKEVHSLEKHYRQNEPEQFLVMYDVIRDKLNAKE